MEGVKAGGVLWLEGFGEACCLHRVLILCLRSRTLLVRTGQCFLLNGFIFLGSIFVLNSVVIPALWWILPDQCSQLVSHKLCDLGGTLKFYSFLRLALIQLFYVLWFYPLYVFSIVLSTIWYNDIAKYGYAAMGRSKLTVEKGSSQNNSPTIQNAYHAKRPSGLGGVMIGIGEQVYSILLLSIFFLEVYATGFIPYVGKVLNFLLLSWMYAYYCFEYKWNFNEVALDKRLDYFESYWPFFAGFGSPCVLAIFFFSPLVSYGIMAILFPLFVLTATGSEAEQEISFEKHKWRAAGVERFPIFYVADNVSQVTQKVTRVVINAGWPYMIDEVANCYGCGCYLFYPWTNGTRCKTEKCNEVVVVNDSAITDDWMNLCNMLVRWTTHYATLEFRCRRLKA